MESIVIGLIVMLISSYFIALSIGRNPFPNSKSTLPELVNGMKSLKWYMSIVFLVGLYRFFSGVVSVI